MMATAPSSDKKAALRLGDCLTASASAAAAPAGDSRGVGRSAELARKAATICRICEGDCAAHTSQEPKHTSRGSLSILGLQCCGAALPLKPSAAQVAISY